MRALLCTVFLLGCVTLPPTQVVENPMVWRLRTWGFSSAIIIVQQDAPACLAPTIQKAWLFLNPSVYVEIVPSVVREPRIGEIMVRWKRPAKASLIGVAGIWAETPDWTAAKHIMRARIDVEKCDVRLLAHELGHALGLINVDEPGQLMSTIYTHGGWELSPAEIRVLRQ